MNYPVTLHKDRYPSPHCAHAWMICSWYLLLVYTRYYSNPTAVLCTGNITLFAHTHKDHDHGFPDFPVQQYPYFHIIFYFLPAVFFIFSWLSSIPHYYLFIPGVLYRTYWNITIYTHLVHIHTWYIRTAAYVVPWYHTYGIYYQVLI